MKRFGEKHLLNEKGISLLEVIATIVLLSIVLISFFKVFSNTLLFTNLNSDNIQATNIVKEIESTIKTLDWDLDIKNSIYYKPIDKNSDSKIDYYLNEQNINGYKVKVKIMNIPESKNLYRQLRQVHINLSKDGREVSQTFTYHEGEKK